jgi:hypothetical protein
MRYGIGLQNVIVFTIGVLSALLRMFVMRYGM